MSSSIWVIKVGGSLLDWPELPGRLVAFLDGFRTRAPEARPLLIAGGGPPANWVRQRDADHRFSDEAAHRLAIHAMDLSAHMLAAMLPGSIIVDRLEQIERPDFAVGAETIAIALPSTLVRELEDRGADRLSRSWNVTSDSIAAWAAVHLGARGPVLLKSAAAPRGADRTEAARIGLVDPDFPRASQPLEHVELLNLRDWIGPVGEANVLWPRAEREAQPDPQT